MTLEIIKGFFTIKAAVHAFAGSGSKLAYKFGMVGMTAGALYGLFPKHFIRTELLFGIRGCNAVCF